MTGADDLGELVAQAENAASAMILAVAVAGSVVATTRDGDAREAAAATRAGATRLLAHLAAGVAVATGQTVDDCLDRLGLPAAAAVPADVRAAVDEGCRRTAARLTAQGGEAADLLRALLPPGTLRLSAPVRFTLARDDAGS